MENLNNDVLLEVFGYLDYDSLLNALQSSKQLAKASNGSAKLLKKLVLTIDPEKFQLLKQEGELSEVQFRNLLISNFKKRPNELRNFLAVIKNCKKSVEILQLIDFKERSVQSVLEFFKNLPNLASLKVKSCFIQEEVDREILPPLLNLKEISFETCDENYFKIFRHQKSIVKITISNNVWTWNGFHHDGFNELVRTLPNFRHLVLVGMGTGSYFDCDNFPFKIEILETTLITFHWYVGIRTGRIGFLSKQLGHLKELTIQQLPFDFDGGKVLKYIIEKMKLNKFYYGKIPLIIDGQKQVVREFSASEIQLCSTFEMFNQFPSIQTFILNLGVTDIDSSEVERIINPRTAIFDNVQTLEVLDNSGYRNILGVFLGLFKNFRNIKKLKIQSPDPKLNDFFEEFLPSMPLLEEIVLDSQVSKEAKKLAIIRNNVPNLKNISIIDKCGTILKVFPINSND